MSDPRIRILKIKTGVVKRLAKEKVTYEKEAAQQRERIQKLKEQGENIMKNTIGRMSYFPINLILSIAVLFVVTRPYIFHLFLSYNVTSFA